jgi:anti-sigma B factor antagonist
VEGQPFAVSQEQRGALPLLRVRGELDIYTAPRLKEAIIAALGPERSFLAIDLSGVSFLDSTGSQVLMSAKQRTAERGGELYIIGAQRQVLRLFHLVGLDQIFHLCDEADLPAS